MEFYRQYLHVLNKKWEGRGFISLPQFPLQVTFKGKYFFNAHVLNVLMFSYDCCLMNRIFITFKYIELRETAGKIF